MAIATTHQPRVSTPAFCFDNSFARELQGLYVSWQPAAVAAPRLLFLNYALAEELGLDVAALEGPAGAGTRAPDVWLARWRARGASEDGDAGHDVAMAGIERARAMRGVNPGVIARNHRVEEALTAASDGGDLAPLKRLLDALKHPYDGAVERTPYAEPAPAAVTACYRTFCGT